MAAPHAKTTAGDTLQLRPVSPTDHAFLCQLYASTRAQELAMINWHESQKTTFLRMQFEAQCTHYKTHFPEAEDAIVLYRDAFTNVNITGEPQTIGRIYVVHTLAEIRLLDIMLMPNFRNRKIGTQLIQSLQTDATKRHIPLILHVAQNNHDALRFYLRLGFRHDKNIQMHWHLKWIP